MIKTQFKNTKHANSSTFLNKTVAVLCAVTVWFSINVSETAYAMQDGLVARNVSFDSRSGSENEMMQANGPSAASDSVAQSPVLDEGSTLLGLEYSTIATVALLVGFSLVAYSIATAGKNGWGWFTMCVAVGVIAFCGRFTTSLIREVASSGDCPPDWDE